jgi:segregation and condensation protein B
MSGRELESSIEAILMVVEEPLSEVVLAQIIERPTEEIAEALSRLQNEYESQERGFLLKQISGGWRFYSHPDFAPLVEKFVLDGQQAKLTQAALETLAVIAYRQPISRARVSAIRGVNVEAVMKTLLSRSVELNMKRARSFIGLRTISLNELGSITSRIFQLWRRSCQISKA